MKQGIEHKVISCDGAPKNVLVWCYSEKQCHGDVEVIVPFTHEAIAMKNGQLNDTLTNGKYVLNVAKREGFFRRVVDEPFQLKLFFINKELRRLVEWGTYNRPIKIIDPLYNIPIEFKGGGTYKFHIENSMKFIRKLIGGQATTGDYNLDDFELMIRDEILHYFNQNIAKAMQVCKISSYDLSANLVEVSKIISESIQPILEEYGIIVDSFIVDRVIIDSKYIDQMETLRNQNAVDVMKTQGEIDLKKIRMQGQNDLNQMERENVIGNARMEAEINRLRETSYKEENERLDTLHQNDMDTIVRLASLDSDRQANEKLSNLYRGANPVNPLGVLNQTVIKKKQCPICKNYIPEEDTFCPYCGSNTNVVK